MLQIVSKFLQDEEWHAEKDYAKLQISKVQDGGRPPF